MRLYARLAGAGNAIPTLFEPAAFRLRMRGSGFSAPAICFDSLSLIELKIGNWALPTPHPVRKEHLARNKKRLQNGAQSERF